jgi:hypothetical protein
VVNFLIQLAATYILNRLTQPNGPRVTELAAGLGDYGVPKPRLYGETVRIAGVVMAQADIKETTHKKKPILDYFFGIVGALLPPVKTYTYSDTLAILVADRTDADPIEDLVKLYAGGKLIFNRAESAVVSEDLDADGNLVFRKYGKNKYCTSVTVYGGGAEQVADPALEAALGTQPGYRRSAYVSIEALQLKDFGNTVPVPIEALVQVSSSETMASVAESISAAAGIDYLHDISSTALISDVVRGYAISGETNCWDALKPLLPAYAIDCAEVAGQLRFYRRTQSIRATIPSEDMGAYVYGDSPPDKYNFTREPDLNLPREFSLTFIDPEREYQTNTATSRRSEGNAKSNVASNISLVLTADEGATAAALMLWDAWLGRTQVQFTLTDAWHSLSPGLAYAIEVAGQYVPYRVTIKTRGANGITEVSALSDESVTYTASVAGTSGTPIDPGSTLFPDTRVVAMDSAILNDSDDEYGFYIAMGGANGWSQGQVDLSTDGVTFETVEISSDSAVIGDVTGTLVAGATTGLDDTLDTTTVLTVVLLDTASILQSATDAELDAMANFAFVGKDGLGEYLQFKTATFVSGSTWQLTNLRRGRKGSDWAIATHASGEEFVLISEGGVFRLPASTTDNWGVPLTLRGLSLNQDEADAVEVDFTNTGEGKRPYSPVNVEGTWDGSNNLTITWDSRSRLNAGGLGIDDNAEWDIEITTGAGQSATVVAETYTYTAADQIIDGILPGDSIAGRVRQTSDVNDGRWRNFLLLGPDDTWELEDDLTSIHLEDGSTPLALEA